MKIRENSTILFQGDSITDAWRTWGGIDPRFYGQEEAMGIGFPNMFAAMAAATHPDLNLKIYNRAISGNRTVDLLNRWEKDCLTIRPDYLIILIGINDVWRHYDANDETPTDQYINNYASLIAQAKKNNPDLEVVIIEPSYLKDFDSDEQASAFRAELVEKIEALRKFAKSVNAHYIPMDGILAGLSMTSPYTKWVFDDGVHLTNCGHAVVTQELFKIFEL